MTVIGWFIFSKVGKMCMVHGIMLKYYTTRGRARVAEMGGGGNMIKRGTHDDGIKHPLKYFFIGAITE